MTYFEIRDNRKVSIKKNWNKATITNFEKENKDILQKLKKDF